MRGRVMSLYMMVFVGGTPIGGPIMGWITDTFGARVGFLSGGVISAVIAVVVGLALARAGGLRLRVDLRRGHRHLRFVARDGGGDGDGVGDAGDESRSGDAGAVGVAEGAATSGSAAASGSAEPGRERDRVASASGS